LTSIPEGLNRTIKTLVIRIGYMTNKLDYIHLSIICTYSEMEQIMSEIEEYTINVKKAQDNLIRIVMGDLASGRPGRAQRAPGRAPTR
jgi:hypothetical protein